MEDLIKREDAIKAMEQRYQDILRIFKRKVKDGEKAVVLDMIGCIKSLSSADRPQGEWIDKGDYAVCSNCGTHSGTQFDGVEPVPRKTNYCPNCGCRMKGANDEISCE